MDFLKTVPMTSFAIATGFLVIISLAVVDFSFAVNSNGKREIRRLTSGDFHITAFDWSVDGKTIAFSHQINPSPDKWSTSDISSVPSDSGAVTTLVTGPGADRFPRYSPDGKWLAFPSDEDDPNWALLSDVYIIGSRRKGKICVSCGNQLSVNENLGSIRNRSQ